MMKKLNLFTALTIISTGLLSTTSTLAQTKTLKVVTSIKPIHSLVSNVMNGVGEPSLLVKGSASPHGYALKPSQAGELQNADIVFWVGHGLETFLEKPIDTIANKAQSIELEDLDGIAPIEKDDDHKDEHKDHDDHEKHADHKDEHKDHDDHEKHEDHKDEHKNNDDHEKHEDHKDEHKDHDDHEKHADHKDEHKDHDDHEKHADHDEDGHEGHNHGANAHLWLNPQNAKVIVNKVLQTLAEADPNNADAYKANAKATLAKLDTLHQKITAEIKPVADGKFVLFHNAYEAFEQQYGLHSAGVITLNPEATPSAARISELQEKVRNADVKCIFSEPQFDAKLTKVVAEGSDTKLGTLDPLGATLNDGPELYFDLIENISSAFVGCLK